MDFSLGAVSKRILQAIIDGQQPNERDIQIIVDDWRDSPDRVERLHKIKLSIYARQLNTARMVVQIIDEESDGD